MFTCIILCVFLLFSYTLEGDVRFRCFFFQHHTTRPIPDIEFSTFRQGHYHFSSAGNDGAYHNRRFRRLPRQINKSSGITDVPVATEQFGNQVRGTQPSLTSGRPSEVMGVSITFIQLGWFFFIYFDSERRLIAYSLIHHSHCYSTLDIFCCTFRDKPLGRKLS